MDKLMRMPSYFLSHGGGPWPYMTGHFRDLFRSLEQSLTELPGQLPRVPKALLVVTAHWEEKTLAISCSAQPGMLHDYYGFPEHLYNLSYPAPGHPLVAEQIALMLEGAGWSVRRDTERGYDHGVFSLLKPIYPLANIPVVQLSIRNSLDAREHFEIGKVLAPLRDEGVLILGSGQSFHNLNTRESKNVRLVSSMFDQWLRHTLMRKPPEQRATDLFDWKSAPAALDAHPRADHFIPLLVALGAAADESAQCVFSDYVSNFATSSYRFGGDQSTSAFDKLRGQSW
jgi:aromatic ring-opening dioxygenase catalytic subunit (LigB family)